MQALYNCTTQEFVANHSSMTLIANNYLFLFKLKNDLPVTVEINVVEHLQKLVPDLA